MSKTKSEAIALGYCFRPPQPETVVTCFRCGHKVNSKDAVEVGYEVFKCGCCIEAHR